MKNKKNLLLVPAIALGIGFVFSAASAQETVAVKTEKAVETQAVKGGNPNVVKTEADSTSVETTAATASQEKVKKEKGENKGQINAAEHRSAVASFVKSLLAVADREGGIGQQVKVIAQEQNDSKEKVAAEIEAVESRGKLKTFFLGTDYKNIGALRKEMVQTKNQIDQLKRLVEKAENEADKTELQAQIQVLSQQQSGIETFITQNESKFSLFGWASKLLNK